MEHKDFIIGKWYKNLGSTTSSWVGRYAANTENTGFWGDMFITPKREFDMHPGYLSGISKAELCSIEEIARYLPEGHPDIELLVKQEVIEDLSYIKPLLKLLEEIKN